MKKILLTIAAACMVFAGCSSDEPTIVDNKDIEQSGEPGSEDPETPTPSVVMPKPTLNAAESRAAAGQTDFGADFFAAVSQNYHGKNVMVSPMSASMLLSMLANAADATTRNQICEALGCSDIEAVNSLSKKYMTWLPGADEGITMSLANSLWYKQNYTLNPDFVKIAEEYYNAETFARDFAKENILIDEINSWTRLKTGEIIEKILEMLDPDAVAVQVNALYFKGAWTEAFSETQTVKADFKGVSGTVKVDMMKTKRECLYAATDAFEAIEIPYGENGYCSIVMVVPRETSDIDNFIASEAFKSIPTTSMDYKLVNLSMPKFKIEPDTNVSLNEILASIGIDNLDNMQKCNLFTESVNSSFRIYQKAGIDVDEHGTEAAAATWSGWETAPDPSAEKPQTIDLIIDHPFVFFIKENNTGLSLFAGKVNQL